MGSHQEQVTAIQSAALAAATDASRIIVEDPYFGLIGLSDYPPKGNGILAQDNYAVPVTGINTLLATVRLDMIIADKLNDNTLRALALRDYQAAMQSKTLLTDELTRVVEQNQPGADVNGDKVNPYTDALSSYQSNPIRLTEGGSHLVPGSLKLKLGCVDNLATNTPIPTPSNCSSLAQTQQINGFYKAYVNAPYNNHDFVLAAIGDAPKLVDQTQFQENASNLPYSIPTVIRCEAIQEFVTKDEKNNVSQRRVTIFAAAEPGCCNQRPSPGAFAVNFPYGYIGEITDLYTLLTHTQICKPPIDQSLTAVNGDYPPNSLAELQVPIFDSTHPPFGSMLRVAFYDWIRRGGPDVDVDKLLAALKEPLVDIGGGQMHLFQITADGGIAHTVQPSNPLPDFPVSHNQIYCVSGLGFHDSNKHEYDVYLRDYVYQPGRTRGGIHAGQPLDLVDMTSANGSSPPTNNSIRELPNNIGGFPMGPPGGGNVLRPSYEKLSIAVEVRFRKRT